jgi:hypothetical protein
MNFCPLLILINTDFKRITLILVMAGVVILAGHYIMPGTVGDRWFIEFQKLLLFFSSLDYLFLLFYSTTKKSIVTKKKSFH